MFIELIADYKQKTPNAIAILAPQKQPITYDQLFQHLVKTTSSLQQLGITHTDRVALVMNNGPEMATAFLAIGSVAVCVPMNSKSSLSEFKTYLSAVKAKALVIDYGLSTEATKAAMELEIEIITVTCEGDEAGIFDIVNEPSDCQTVVAYSKPEDIALILFTSGTTGKPKIVPLSHSNIYSCTQNIVSSLRLSSRDRCLNVMPLFHSGGLVMSLLSSLFAGGSIICTTGLVASQFFGWLSELSPTWYSAVPTTHQVVLQQWEHMGQPAVVHSLRFIRCGSAALPPLLAQKIESALRVPIIEGYGSSEAVSQIAVNPLPPGLRKLGSAGKPAGCQVEIMDEFGNLLPAGVSGEIVIQGASVFSGYENDVAANVKSFYNGWFRTGDHGYIDSDGYLYIKGRFKEIINCGGAKISPREIEEVLLSHPAVKEVVAFAIPHLSLGEVVAVAIVTKGEKIISEDAVQRYASKHVIYYKVPHKVVFVDNIPKESTGKINRIGMAEKLGVTVSTTNTANSRTVKTSACNELEHKMMEIWRKILKKSDIRINESFFTIGGDSLTATFLSVQMEEIFGKYVPVSLLYENDTIEKLVGFLLYEEEDSPYLHLVPLQTAGNKPPLFTIDTIGGHISHYRTIAGYLGKEQPVYALRLMDEYSETASETIEEIASNYVREIRRVQPEGPYYLTGYSLGGTIAFEVAQQLYRQDQEVALLAMLDTRNHKIYPLRAKPKIRKGLWQWITFYMQRLRAMPDLHTKIDYILHRLRREAVRGIVGAKESKKLTKVGKRWKKIVQYRNLCYVPLRYPGQLTLFRAVGDPFALKETDLELGWNGMADGGLVVYETPGDHISMLTDDDNIEILAKKLSLCMFQEKK